MTLVDLRSSSMWVRHRLLSNIVVFFRDLVDEADCTHNVCGISWEVANCTLDQRLSVHEFTVLMVVLEPDP